jgi:hypothetical protein
MRLDSSKIFLALISEAEQNAQKKKEAVSQKERKGFGYYQRVFTHFSIKQGIAKLK